LRLSTPGAQHRRGAGRQLLETAFVIQDVLC
jgi:hypothetical protein